LEHGEISLFPCFSCEIELIPVKFLSYFYEILAFQTGFEIWGAEDCNSGVLEDFFSDLFEKPFPKESMFFFCLKRTCL